MIWLETPFFASSEGLFCTLEENNNTLEDLNK